jgi:sec-independent protein translocase protein TatC
MKKQKISFDDELPITSHLEELRWRLVTVLIALAVLFVVSFSFSERILLLLKRPIQDYELIILSPTEAFFAHLKLSFFVALLIVAPVIFYEIWAFVSPGLLQKEKRYTIPFVVFASLFFILGLTFCYYVILPFGLKFLLTYKTTGITPKLSISQYLSFYTRMMLVFGVVFELPVATIFLTKIGVIRPAFLTRNRKYAILVIFLISAILTPPDIVTQILMAIPLLLLYEISIMGSKIIYRQKAENKEKNSLSPG